MPDDRIDIIRDRVATFPKSPGVYLMKDMEGRVLYGYAYAPGLAFRVVRRLLLYRRSVKQKGWLGPLRYVEYVWGVRGLRSLPGRALNFLRRSWRLPGRA